jgi:phospholipid-binding lipoprotein MlaA
VRRLRRLSAVLLVAAGCATTGERDPRDPLEPLNRAVYRFNDAVDEAVAKPVATAYRDLLHEEIRGRVRNFFANLGDLWIGANDVLQGKFFDGFESGMRFVFNSTLGLFGLHDVASEMGIEKRNEDFGQTFGWWGAGEGPYLVLPFFGSSTARDALGMARHGEVHGVLGQEHRHVEPALERGAGDEEGDQDALGVLQARRQIDQHLLSHPLSLRDRARSRASSVSARRASG